MQEEKQKLCVEILQNCRNELYHYFPFLDGAFASVGYRSQTEFPGLGTDGIEYLYDPDTLMKWYLENPARVTRGYLHMLLHCLFLHIFPEQWGLDRDRWNIACDIAVEALIEKELILESKKQNERLHGTVTEESCLERGEIQKKIRRRTFQCLFKLESNTQNFSAQQIYQFLGEDRFQNSQEDLAAAFSFDDHHLWYEWKEDGRKQRAKKKWEQIRVYTSLQQGQQKKKAGTEKGDAEETAIVSKKNRYDYHTFLRQFAIPREEMELDLESFDYIFYHLGMEEYGDMPLIEPLEYKEVNRLEELVIAIDTSGSCSLEIVQQFLAETYSMLSQKENFFHKMKVYLIQCDTHIQEVKVIHSEKEWKEYSESMRIQGRGGTDFRRVFQLVEELREKKEIKNLKALIYFTDGDGIYPRQKPDYETAFVLLKEKAHVEMVPEWAVKLII